MSAWIDKCIFDIVVTYTAFKPICYVNISERLIKVVNPINFFLCFNQLMLIVLDCIFVHQYERRIFWFYLSFLKPWHELILEIF